MPGQIDDSQIDWTSPAGDLVLDGSGNHSTRKNNLSGGAAPDGSASFSAGYAIGSLWQWGQRIWRCYGDGQWDELLRNPAGAADGKFLGHASGVPAWVDGVEVSANIRILWGNISSGGGILSGSGGYSASRTGTGQYLIDWSPNLSATPIVVATCENTFTAVSCRVMYNGSSSTYIHTYYVGSATYYFNVEFNFIAIVTT